MIGFIVPLLAAVAAGDATAWRKPPALRPGDTIAFVAPAGPAQSAAPLREYASRLGKAGYKVVIPDGIARRSGFLAGTDDERAAELNAAIRDPKVRAIFPVRGGYGLTRILDRIDYAALRKDPKIVTGYSDLTALHLAIARHARVVSFHSPMPLSDLAKAGEKYAFAAASFRRALFADQYEKGVEGYAVGAPAGGPRPVKLVGGKARGRLMGGNLTLVCSTLGTPYAVRPEGAVLLLEEVNEAPYRVDRSLSQLRLAGVLGKVAGVIVGDFRAKDEGEARETDRVLRGYLGGLKVPVVMNFPAGHVAHNATLPHGALVEIDGDAAAVRVAEDPVVP
jgi:muramoyltetrapeptide carboxypeptidase